MLASSKSADSVPHAIDLFLQMYAQACQIAQFTNLAGRNETGSQQSMLQQSGNPFTVFFIRLLPGSAFMCAGSPVGS